MERPLKVNGMWDTHTHYRTINHTHMSYINTDSLLIDLCLVECQDGRWFIVDDTSEIEDDNIFDKCSDEFIEPKFFDNEEKATEYAIDTIHKKTGVSRTELNKHFSG